MSTLEQRRHYVRLRNIIEGVVAGPMGPEFIARLGLQQSDVFPCGRFNQMGFWSLCDGGGLIKENKVAEVHHHLSVMGLSGSSLEQFRTYASLYTGEKFKERDLLYSELADFVRDVFRGPLNMYFCTLSDISYQSQPNELLNLLREKDIFHYDCTYPMYDIFLCRRENLSELKLSKYLEYHQKYLVKSAKMTSQILFLLPPFKCQRKHQNELPSSNRQRKRQFKNVWFVSLKFR